MPVPQACSRCGSSLKEGASYCGHCGMRRVDFPVARRRASGSQLGTWIWRVVGLGALIGVVALIGTYCYGSEEERPQSTGAMPTFAPRLIGSVVEQDSASSEYSLAASDIVNGLADDVDRLFADAEPYLTQCEAGSLSACDSAVETFGEASRLAQKGYDELSRLDPPVVAAQWHRDYLSLLAEQRDALGDVALAWDRKDFVAFDLVIDKLDSLGVREEELVNYFNENLR